MAKPLVPAVMDLARSLIAENFAGSRTELVIGGVSVGDLARTYGTPLFAYDSALMRRSYRSLRRAVSGFAEVYYSIKANPNPAVASLFVEEGAGLEVASGGEFLRARAAGCAPQRILFAGPGKSPDELALTIEAGIGEIHLETFEEIEHVGRIATKLGRRVPVAVRINPVSAARGGAMQMGGRPAPFGFDEEDLEAVLSALDRRPLLDMCGIHVFAGTQILDAQVLLEQWSHSLSIAARVARRLGRPLKTLDLGGGLGIPYYAGDKTLDLEAVALGVPKLRAAVKGEPLLRETRVILEPGRYLTGSAGVYLISVRAAKVSRSTRFLVCDGGMHHHLAASGNLGQVVKRDYPIVAACRLRDNDRSPCHVVGPLCTPLDSLGRNALLPSLREGDLIAVLQSGAYGLTASPTGFLSHPTPVEVLIENALHQAIRLPSTLEAAGISQDARHYDRHCRQSEFLRRKQARKDGS
jgi:diaminopimelate decarboxylase